MTEAEAWQSVEKYRERFDVKGIFECSLYDGVREAIARFKEHGYLLALASSKPETACRRILEHFDLLGYFDEVVGSTLDGSISTKAEVLEELGRRMAGSHIGKNELCLIGDTKYDAAGAKAFGIRCIGVSYGFGTREELLAAGAEAVFGRIEEVEAYIENDEVKGIETNTGQTLLGPVILATGHSARDVYRWLAANQVEIEAKGIAVGVRLEHPAELIDRIQYHSRDGRGKYLPAAEYSFVTQVDGRGVYSFCMCPGGFVVPAASGPRQIVVNGMSPSNRGSRWSNSGMVVEVRPEDLANDELRIMSEEPTVQQDGVADPRLSTLNSQLSMMYFQESLEYLCWQQGNMKQTAPAQRMADFTKKKLSYDLPESSYAPGLVSSPLHFWMPPFIANRLSKGFQQFGKYSHGFLTNEATMIGVETRTSSPVRIIRDKDTLQHVRLKGLFPCGEGAGYAGGIVSAGIDGERCAEAVGRLLL